MNIDQALYTYLQSVTAITAKVSTRIYPAIAAQGATYPYITYQEIGLDEGETNEAEHYRKYYQLTIYARNYTDARDIAELIETAFYHKPLATYTGIRIAGGSLAGSRDIQPDTATGVFARAVDVRLNYLK
jgi:hypothetical protein